MNICLIGFNLTNFLLAILLSKKGFEVDIIFDDKNKSKTNNRTIGISKKNIEFLKSILNIPNQFLWPILQIEILNLKNNPSKKIKFKAHTDLIRKVKKITKIPVVAIGGINSDNYKKLLLNKANFLAISGYIWNNKKLKPLDAIRKLK